MKKPGNTISLIRAIWPVRMLFVLTIFSFPASGFGQQNKIDLTVKVPYRNKSYVGRPLAWDGEDMMLLRRDGKISILPVESEEDYTQVKAGFDPYSPSDLRVLLQKEFGQPIEFAS